MTVNPRFIDATGKRNTVRVFGKVTGNADMTVEDVAGLVQAGILEINEVEGGGHVVEIAPLHSWWDVNRYLHGSGD